MKRILYLVLLLIYSCMMQSCNSNDALLSTEKILVTSESGNKLTEKENIRFIKGVAEGTVLKVEPEATKQPIDGIGSSFTESSAFVLAHLEPSRRTEVMEAIYSETGANFSMKNTTSCP
jgi:glucosylceramidase